MTQVNALFSPETSPYVAELQPFRLLCDTISFYILPGASEEREIQRGYEPVRLSPEEQTRFQSLIKELKGHEAEFHGGLLASLSAAHGDRDEASVGALISTLRLGTKNTPKQKLGNEGLWQAMLILQLAEMFREEEREISRGFLDISGKEAELFAALRGEEEQEVDEEAKEALREFTSVTTPGGPTINLLRMVKAWGSLYLLDLRAAEFPLLVTTSEELGAQLAEMHEKLTGGLPVQLVSLVLPTQAVGEDYAVLTKNFRAATEDAREHFNRALLEIAASGTISAGSLTELQEAGNNLNQVALPLLQNGSTKKTLRFYAYEGSTLTELFAGLCGGTAPPKGPAAVSGLLAVLA